MSKKTCEQRYYKKHRIKLLKRQQTWHQNNKERDAISHKRRRLERINSWSIIIPKETVCEVCGKIIYFRSPNRKDTIHFDHRYGGAEPIKINPSSWLESKIHNAVNEKIWRNCNFGYVCGYCNNFLPTKNRETWIVKAYEYIKKTSCGSLRS